MVRYKVLKEFIEASSGKEYQVGDFIDSSKLTPVYEAALSNLGYITVFVQIGRWRQKSGKQYWSVGINPTWQNDSKPDHIHVLSSNEDGDYWDDRFYEGFNYFKSEDTAKKVAKALDLFFRWLHYDKQSTDDRKPVLLQQFQVAQREARKAVIRDNKNFRGLTNEE